MNLTNILVLIYLIVFTFGLISVINYINANYVLKLIKCMRYPQIMSRMTLGFIGICSELALLCVESLFIMIIGHIIIPTTLNISNNELLVGSTISSMINIDSIFIISYCNEYNVKFTLWGKKDKEDSYNITAKSICLLIANKLNELNFKVCKVDIIDNESYHILIASDNNYQIWNDSKITLYPDDFNIKNKSFYDDKGNFDIVKAYTDFIMKMYSEFSLEFSESGLGRRISKYPNKKIQIIQNSINNFVESFEGINGIKLSELFVREFMNQ